MARSFPSLSALGAGLAGGAVFYLVELVFLPIEKNAPADLFVRLSAALLAGPVTLAWPAGHLGAMLVLSFIACFTFAVVLGLFFCRMEDGLSIPASILAATLMGFALYLVGFHLLALAFPLFRAARGPTTLVACVLFGVTTALMHKGLSQDTLRSVRDRSRKAQVREVAGHGAGTSVAEAGAHETRDPVPPDASRPPL
jgi:hypothetical protein